MDRQREKNKAEKKGGKLIVAVCISVIIILTAVIGFLMQQIQNGSEEETQPRRNVVVNEENAEEIAEDIKDWKPVAGGQYEVIMNSRWSFTDGKSPSENAYVENAAANTNDVYFDINLADTDDLIYSSPLLPIGSYLDSITLDRELDKGTYDCILTYHLVDEDQKTLSTLKISLTILIEN